MSHTRLFLFCLKDLFFDNTIKMAWIHSVIINIIFRLTAKFIDSVLFGLDIVDVGSLNDSISMASVCNFVCKV